MTASTSSQPQPFSLAVLNQSVALAKAVLAGIASEELAHQVLEMQGRLAGDEEVVTEARRLYASDDIEIDDVPLVSIGERGAWVSAWVWVPSSDAGDEEDVD